ncbi:alpha/beta hydrolase family protein [Paenibacillus eucommiae]|uniref:Pimeloyl-ACP methyl ester carboxylesterase n=1 Tax=Paenibacillus eucommiae TaxID=1355755 RepID=A0ABS4J5A0_9BACL|nr:prolyl oligopeptidase family serine peptidase [Paenibacillus eucommiae]MBP1994286.1 pimeloyl-ACP methyl ester carboxylesterase [Paenibacillus eucommiae]
MAYEQYEDRIRLEKQTNEKVDRTSPFCDFIYYESSTTLGLRLAARVLKPEKPGYIVAGTHGWHMGIRGFKPMDHPLADNKYLRIEVDMRGRPYSEGDADCNGWELYDIIDAIEYVRIHYAEYIVNPDIVYFEAGSGGGGNALAIVGKFPDTFAAATSLCGISDYALWYNQDAVGEFRDELDVWIGCSPAANPMAYRSRSGLETVGNLCTSLYIVHGESDIRVPSEHSRRFVAKAAEAGKSRLVRYRELPGVGAQSHWDHASAEMMGLIAYESEENRRSHRLPVLLPASGTLTVAGYVFTRSFSLILDSIDKVATLEYDMDKGMFELFCELECDYTLTVGRERFIRKAIQV